MTSYLYPLHRRALTFVDLTLTGRRYISHCMMALDRVREIYGVRCGPLAADRSALKDDSIPGDHGPSHVDIAQAA